MDKAVDILHPLASLEWRECRGPPGQMVWSDDRLQAVCLKDKVYMAGWENSTHLYIYNPASDTWDTMNTTVYGFTLTTYHSQLVLIGGREYVGDDVHGRQSNKLWTLSEDGQWQETIPPMELDFHYNLSASSHGDYLFVLAYGYQFITNKILVFSGHHWTSTNQAPLHLAINVCSTIANGNWYLFGSTTCLDKTKVYSISLDSLIASCQLGESSQSSSVWKRLTDVPDKLSSSGAVFGNRLIAVGSKAIYAYSPFTHSWIQVDNYYYYQDTTLDVHVLFFVPCVLVLFSNELMVMRINKAYKVTLDMTPFNPKSTFNMKALSLLDKVGIPLMDSLSIYTPLIQSKLGFLPYPSHSLNTLLDSWLDNVRPTWKDLLSLIHELHLDDLAQQVETYLSGVTVEQRPKEVGERSETVMAREDGDQLSNLINNLVLTLVLANKEFKTKNELLIGQPFIAPVNEEDAADAEEKHGPFKIEPKEEVVMKTKAEPTSAQPTAAWDLRGVEVCGEMAVVVNSSHAQQIEWKGFGLKFTIHEGSLPADVQQCVIAIKASLTGQYEFPENSHLVSAVFWLRCEPMCKFTKPITVEIQHCARSENVANLNLKFVRAVCSQKQLPYTFKQLRGNFTGHSSYGVIELNSFSGLAITQEGSINK